MSAIEHLLPWAQQPQGRFRLLRDSPLFGALSLVALPNHGPRNLVSGYLGAYYGAPLLNAGPGGLELDSSMSGRNRLRFSPEFTSSSTPQAAIYDVSVLSALVITYQTGTENADFALGRMNGSGSPGWAVGLHSGSSNGPAARLGSFSLGGFSGGYRRSEPTVVLLTGDGSTARVYENGAEVSSGSYTAPYYAYSSYDGRSVLMGGKGTDGASQCRTSLGLFWSGRVIPPAVAALLTSPAEVWRLLVEPRRIWVPVAAGGGGTTVALSGISATFAQTAPAVSSATPLVGESVTANAGILLPAFSRSLSGQAGTAFAGTLSPSTSRGLSGQSAAFTAGSVIPSVAIVAIGLQATFASGTLTASSSSGTTVNLVGEPVAFAQTAPSISVTVALTGIAATMAAGILSSSSGTATITVKAGSWLRYKKLQ